MPSSNTLFFSALKEEAHNPITVEDRLHYLNQLLRQIIEHRGLIKQSITKDFSKPDAEIDFTEVIPIIKELKHTIKNLKTWVKPKSVSKTVLHANASGKVQTQPKGVVLIISPWNYPFSLAIEPLISAIAAGNRVVLKPSEFTPQTTEVLIKIITDVFPESVVQVVVGGADIASELTMLPFNHIFFTGSPSVGKLVMAAAAKNLCSVTLELGGKSPCVLDNNFSIETFAKRVIWGKFVNAGQTCIAPDYLLVPKNKKTEVIAALVDSIHLKFPNHIIESKDTIHYARIINEKHTLRLKALIDDAISKGAKLEFGGEILHSERIIKPTIISNIDATMMIDSEEIFGPILPIYTFDNDEELLKVILSKPHPLATYLFSRDKYLIDMFKTKVRTGALVTNDVLSHYVHKHLPFGGINNSGIGRSHGYYGFLEFSNQLSVLETGYGPVGADILSQPYNDKTNYLINKAIKYL